MQKPRVWVEFVAAAGGVKIAARSGCIYACKYTCKKKKRHNHTCFCEKCNFSQENAGDITCVEKGVESVQNLAGKGNPLVADGLFFV